MEMCSTTEQGEEGMRELKKILSASFQFLCARGTLSGTPLKRVLKVLPLKLVRKGLRFSKLPCRDRHNSREFAGKLWRLSRRAKSYSEGLQHYLLRP